MAERNSFIRFTTAILNLFTGEDGECIVDTSKKTLTVHDGATPGGTPLAREDMTNVPAATSSVSGKMTNVQAAALAQALLDITAAEGNIVTNAGDIGVNAAAIISNDVDIAANLALINTNITNIAANVTAIGLRALADASPTNNEMLKQDGSGDLVGAGFLATAVVLLTGAQTLASKTLTAPVINALELNGAITGDAATTDLSASAASDEYAFADAIKAYIDAQIAANPAIGVGQEWQDMSASRVTTTVYQNLTGKPIAVSVAYSLDTDGGATYARAYVDNVTVPVIQVAEIENSMVDQPTDTDTITASMHFIVPDDHYYRILANGGTEIVWAELR